MMQSGLTIGLRTVAAAAAVATLAFGDAPVAQAAERWEPPPVGTRLKDRRVETGSYGQGTSELEYVVQERVSGGRQYVAFVAPGGTSMYTRDGGWEGIYLSSDNSPQVRIDPPLAYAWPLAVGKTFTQDYRMILGNGQPIPFTRTCRIESHDTVNVPAGATRAFRVSCSNSLGEDSVDWFSPELGVYVKRSLKRAASHPFGAGTQEIELVERAPR